MAGPQVPLRKQGKHCGEWGHLCEPRFVSLLGMTLKIQLACPWTLSTSCCRKSWNIPLSVLHLPDSWSAQNPQFSMSLSLSASYRSPPQNGWTPRWCLGGPSPTHSFPLPTFSVRHCPVKPPKSHSPIHGSPMGREPRSKNFFWTVKSCPPISSLPLSPPGLCASPPDLVLGFSHIASAEFCFWAVSSCVFSSLYFLIKSSLYQQENLLWESSVFSTKTQNQFSAFSLYCTLTHFAFIGGKKVLFLKAGFLCQLLYELMVWYQVIYHPCWTQIHSLWYKQSGWESISLVALQPLRCCDSTYLIWAPLHIQSIGSLAGALIRQILSWVTPWARHISSQRGQRCKQDNHITSTHGACSLRGESTKCINNLDKECEEMEWDGEQERDLDSKEHVREKGGEWRPEGR